MSCSQTKFVPAGKFLLKKNVVKIEGDKLDDYDVNSIIRQQPNYKRFGVKWKLMAFNSVDSTKVANKRREKNLEIRAENKRRLKKEREINQKRIEKARSKGLEYYTHKKIPLKDTIEPRMFFREWYKYKVGRPPVIFDSIPYEKSIEQLNSFLKRKGYYYGDASAYVDHRNNQKCVVTYVIKTGNRFIIDSLYLDTINFTVSNPEVIESYNAWLKAEHDKPLIGQPFDIDILEEFRNNVSRFMRDSSFYGFKAAHISFLVDTNSVDMTAKIGVQLGDRVLPNSVEDSILYAPQYKAVVNEVYFHLADTVFYEGNFAKMLQEQGLSLYDGQFIRTLDTLYYNSLEEGGKREEHREAIIYYNSDLYVKPRVLEIYNYLYKGQPYREKWVESSYNGLRRLGVYSIVKVEIKELDNNKLDVHYYLVPSKKQSFGVEPRATNSNGFLGVSASMSYTNRNLFKGAERLTISISGGFESQPPIFDETLDGEKIKTAGRSFNTFEIGPSVKLEVPGFYPFRATRFAQRKRPSTIMSAAYNFQTRSDFTRGTFQMNYSWKFILTKTQILHLGFPGASVVKFVNIDRSDLFTSKLLLINDLFLIDAYSNQFIWQDWKVTYEYNIKEKQKRRSNSQFLFRTNFDPSGNLLSLIDNHNDTTSTGQGKIFGVAYAQFLRLDNELIYSKPLGKERSINLRLIAGGGLPYGNSKNSLPYDYSFFAGGANDNRGWRARALGPGVYKYYLDTNRTATQIGDMRVTSSGEFRFSMNSFFKGAVFLDVGNVWTRFEDPNRPGGNFTKDWYKQLAFATGFGLRMDLEYFIIRVDLGIPIRNPALPSGAQWIWQSRQPYVDEGKQVFGADYAEILPLPFIPALHFGIGYPF